MAKDPSKTEQATPKRLNKARGEGNVPRSQEVSKTLSVFAGYIILSLWIGYVAKQIISLLRHFLNIQASYEISPNSIYILFIMISSTLAKILLPILLFIMFTMILVIRLQVGKLWTTKRLKPKFKFLNIIAGLKRMFASPQTLGRLFKSLLQAIIIGAAPYMVVKNELPFIMQLFDANAAGIAIRILELGRLMVKYALLPMIIIALIDLWYTRWKYKEDLKMSKSEVKDERKQAEGDMDIKRKMQQKMMSMVLSKMMDNVPKADVIITNPVHLAVALRYDGTEAPAPIVVAKGAGRLAERIKELAKENKVPIRENVTLARALYKQTEVGDMIPPELYKAVAIILAQIWKNDPTKQQRAE